MSIEQRRFPRVRTDFGVEFKIKDSDSPPIKAVGVNISEGGIMMRVSEKLAAETLLEVKIVMPPPYGTVHTLARLVYILKSRLDEYPAYGCGVEFIELKEEDRERVRNFVNEEINKLDWKRWL